METAFHLIRSRLAFFRQKAFSVAFFRVWHENLREKSKKEWCELFTLSPPSGSRIAKKIFSPGALLDQKKVYLRFDQKIFNHVPENGPHKNRVNQQYTYINVQKQNGKQAISLLI